MGWCAIWWRGKGVGRLWLKTHTKNKLNHYIWLRPAKARWVWAMVRATRRQLAIVVIWAASTTTTMTCGSAAIHKRLLPPERHLCPRARPQHNRWDSENWNGFDWEMMRVFMVEDEGGGGRTKDDGQCEICLVVKFSLILDII